MSAHAVRSCEPGDVAACLAISNRAAAETAANFALEPEPLDLWQAEHAATRGTHPWFVAEADGRVVGFARASRWKGRCAYAWAVETTVYVDPAHHGRGIGRALYGALFDALRRQGYHRAIAGITLPNDASVALHEAFGMRQVACFEAIGWKFGRWHDVGYWMADLQPPGTPPQDLRAFDAGNARGSRIADGDHRS